MARYTGPKTKKARSFGEAIYGFDKAFERRKYPPGQHGNSRRRKAKQGYALQLAEKQKAKYIYGILERQFRNTFERANRKGGNTGENLIKILETRLDNTVFRLGLAPTRRAARQLVSHKHITLNGDINNIPSTSLRPGDKVAVRGRSKGMMAVQESVDNKSDVRNYSWLDFNKDKMEGTFIAYPEREQVPEKINEQLIVELYSK